MLLDLGLPDSQSFETVLRDRLFPAVAIVVLAGIDDDAIGVRAVESGAQDYISKDALARPMLQRAFRFAVARHRHIATCQTLGVEA